MTGSVGTPMTKTIFTPKIAVDFICCNRNLNQFYKLQADKRWSRHSLQFHTDMFIPANPLSLDDHSNIFIVCVSFILKSYATRYIDKCKLGDLVKKIDAADTVIKNKYKKVVDCLLELKSDSLVIIDTPKSGLDSKKRMQLEKTKDDLLSIYQLHVKTVFKTTNISRIATATKKYSLTKADLFKEDQA